MTVIMIVTIAFSIIAVIVGVVIGIVVTMRRKRRERMAAEDTMTVHCSYCGTPIHVQRTNMPSQVQCPGCGRTGNLDYSAGR